MTVATLTGDNGLLTKAGKAKETAEIGEEKEIISLSLIQAKSEKYNENLDEETFQTALNNSSKDENKAEIIESDEEGFIIRFERSKRCYEVNQDGNIDLAEGAGSKKTLTINCKDSNGTILATENYTIYKSKYSKTLPVIEGYIPEEKTVSGTITGDTTKDVLYYYIIPETQMVFTGLDSSENVTTDSSQIVSYMIGDNSSTNGNGLSSAPTVLSALIIPETHNGKPVTNIGNNAFRACNNITEVDIGNNVTTIGNFGIYNSRGLTKLTIGSGLNSLGRDVVSYCTALKTIIYNNETNVITQMIPGSSNWTEIQVNDNNTKFKVVDNVLYSKDGTILVRVPQGRSGNFTVPEGVNQIGESAMRSCLNITEVNIGNNVTTISNFGIYNSRGLTKLTIGSGLKSLGGDVVSYCTALKTIIYNNETNVITQMIPGSSNWTEIQVNDNNTKFKVVDNVLYSKDGTILVRVPQGRSGNFTVPEGVNQIGESAMRSCFNITEVNIGNNVTTIGAYGMYQSTGLTKLTIGSGLNSLGRNVFSYCSTLGTVIIDSSTISTNLSAQNSYGNLVSYATTVYTKTTPGSYITSNFHVETSDIEGYTKYVKN